MVRNPLDSSVHVGIRLANRKRRRPRVVDLPELTMAWSMHSLTGRIACVSNWDIGQCGHTTWSDNFLPSSRSAPLGGRRCVPLGVGPILKADLDHLDAVLSRTTPRSCRSPAGWDDDVAPGRVHVEIRRARARPADQFQRVRPEGIDARLAGSIGIRLIAPRKCRHKFPVPTR